VTILRETTNRLDFNKDECSSLFLFCWPNEIIKNSFPEWLDLSGPTAISLVEAIIIEICGPIPEWTSVRPTSLDSVTERNGQGRRKITEKEAASLEAQLRGKLNGQRGKGECWKRLTFKFIEGPSTPCPACGESN